MTEIEIHSETFHVLAYRRNYKRCRQCHQRCGTVILNRDPIPFTFRAGAPIPEEFKNKEEVRLLVVCEKCGRRWVPTTGLTLRALGL